MFLWKLTAVYTQTTIWDKSPVYSSFHEPYSWMNSEHMVIPLMEKEMHHAFLLSLKNGLRPHPLSANTAVMTTSFPLFQSFCLYGK